MRHLAGRIAGWILGAVIAAGAIASVFLIDWSRPLPEVEPVVRPVRVLVVGEGGEAVRSLPARVRATTEVTLSFQVPGLIQELPVVRGERVERGQMLAQLDQRDFQSRLTSARVQLQQFTTELEAVTRAYQAGAATTIELARFRTSVDRSQTEVELAEKALEDATLKAPFDGVVADVFVDRFQKVAVGVPVLRMQGRASVRVEVNVDPARVALSPRLVSSTRHSVRFDFLPDREFDAELVEFTSEADPRTQTFLAIFEIEAPDDMLILPGMPATLIERRPEVEGADARSVVVPLDAVAIDSAGTYFVWLIRDGPGGLATTARAPITVGRMADDAVEVRGGLARGQRIAAAGVLELSEGRQVRPVDSGSGTAAPEAGRR